MNAVAAQARRLAVSPYARRLAHERALPLEALRGSGPGGRILAADVTGYVPAATLVVSPDIAAPAAEPSTAASRIAAFATSVALGALRDLLAALESSGRLFDIDDVLLRAAGRAFAQIPDAARIGMASVALELAGRQAVFAMIPEMSLTSLWETRLTALADSRDDAEKPAALSLRVLPASDVRPLMMPLLPGRAMRLTVSLDTSGNHAECLLMADTGSIDEAAAALWLSSLKAAIEHPLRLFV
ncbi:E3 binding domain-containing protein [Mesorhizobium sp. M0902]|uniref:E3 binding domain-containing protein n=1 Tax=Mesorhizobium sp. M0902 TaxID=2957021 RepID=UPI0033387D9A